VSEDHPELPFILADEGSHYLPETGVMGYAYLTGVIRCQNR